MSDSHPHSTDDSPHENDASQTDAMDKSEHQPPRGKDSDEAQREQDRQLDAGEENPT